MFKSVVKIVVPMAAGGESTGSGFVVDASYSSYPNDPSVYILTNAHVVDGVDGGVCKIKTTFEPKALNARVISVSYDADVALLELDPAQREHCKSLYGIDVWDPLRLAEKPPKQLTKCMFIGHPLGIERQTVVTGSIITFMRTNDAATRDTMVPLTDAVCNPGCSGGPALNAKTREVIGLHSFKLRDMSQIDGMSGIRPAHIVRQLLPDLMAPVRNMFRAKAKFIRELSRMLNTNAEPIFQHMPAHIDDLEAFAEKFQKHAVGGVTPSNNPLSLRAFLKKFCLRSDGAMHRGAGAVLRKALQENVSLALEARGDSSWHDVRNEEASRHAQPIDIGIAVPPLLVNMPIIGIETHGTGDASLVTHYLESGGKDDVMLEEYGGAVVASLLPQSLYAKAGGCEEEVIVAMDTEHNGKFKFGMDGQAICKHTATRIQPYDVTCLEPIGSTITFHVITKTGDQAVRHVTLTNPTESELPHTHAVHSSMTSQMVRDENEVAEFGGICITTLRQNHCLELGMEHLCIGKEKYNFHAVVAHVSPSSTAYGHPAMQCGALITHVNGKEVTHRGWSEFVDQLQAACESGHMRLKTLIGSKTALFAAHT